LTQELSRARTFRDAAFTLPALERFMPWLMNEDAALKYQLQGITV